MQVDLGTPDEPLVAAQSQQPLTKQCMRRAFITSCWCPSKRLPSYVKMFFNLVYTKETSRSYELEGEKNTQQIFSHLIVVPNIYVYIPNEPSWLSMQDRSFLLLRGF